MGKDERGRNGTISNNIGEKRYALIVACTAYHIDKFTWGQIHILQNMGYEVHVTASFNEELSRNSSSGYVKQCREKLISKGVKVFELPLTRFPLSFKNIIAFRLLRKQLRQFSYSLLHCHTPTGGLIARISAVRWRKKGTAVIYSAHGFHFFKGAPLLNFLIYYPVEWILARVTDCLIVINSEDEQAAHKMPIKSVIKMNGIGVSREPFENSVPADKSALGLSQDSFVFLCVGELSKRKNQELLIRSFAEVSSKYCDAVLLLAGEGMMRQTYNQLTDSLGLNEKVIFLGWRDDVPALVLMADVIVSAAKQEGLPVNLIEAMMAGKPIIASGCRGNRELAEQAGIVANNEKEFEKAMILLYKDNHLLMRYGQSAKTASSQYESANVDKEMEKLYSDICKMS